MPRLRLGTPLSLARRRRSAIHFPTLRRPISSDVAVVGGGITGATIAWRFAEAGLRVALLEARRVGRGSTAASTALLMQEPDEDDAFARRPLRREAHASDLGAQPNGDARRCERVDPYEACVGFLRVAAGRGAMIFQAG